MRGAQKDLKHTARREFSLFIGLLFFGLVLMPVAIYALGQRVFGDYGGNGYAAFFGTLSGKIRSGDPVAWFLILSPYLAVQTLRLAAFGWRLTARRQPQ